MMKRKPCPEIECFMKIKVLILSSHIDNAVCTRKENDIKPIQKSELLEYTGGNNNMKFFL